MTDADNSPHNLTTDHETIKQWVETRGGTPARATGQAEDDASSLYIVREDETMEGLESLTWNEFFDIFESQGLSFVYQERDVGETDEWFYDLVDRTEVAERASLDSTEVEQSLLEGEVIQSEITETTVIEKTVVETDQIESEIVDSEIIETNLLDRELQQRKLIGASFEGSDVMTTLSADTSSSLTTDTDAGEQSGAFESRDDPTHTDDDDGGILSDDDDDSGLLGDDDDDDGMLSDDDDDDGGLLGDDDDDDGMLSDDDDDDGGLLGDDDSGVLGDDDSTSSMADDEPSSGHDVETPTHSPVERSTDALAGVGVGEQVTLNVQDTVRTTTEVFDRKIVESRVVDRDIIESDTVESDAIDIDMAGIEETILESDLIEGELAGATADTTTHETVPSGAITSERTEGDVIRSQFVERRVVETDSAEHRQLTCEIDDSQLVETVDDRSQIIERAIVDRDAGEEALLREPEAGARTGDEQVEAAEASAASSEEAHRAADAETGVMAGGEAGETDAPGAGGEPQDGQAGTTKPTEDEIGKEVISGDEEVGMVSDVQGETIYVDPHPSLTDKIKAAFEWGEVDEETYPVEREQIESISEDTVHIREI